VNPSDLLGLEAIETPALVYVPDDLAGTIQSVGRLVRAAGAHLLYSVKAQSYFGILEIIAPHVTGFAASSAFEARLSREVVGSRGTVHLTQPGISPKAIKEITRDCDYVAANSVAQFEGLRSFAGPEVSLGIRLNVGLNFVSDDRYAPCRTHSKLGIPLGELSPGSALAARWPQRAEGIHLHHNCESNDLGELYLATERVCDRCDWLMPRLNWVNLGGGYLLPGTLNPHRLRDAVRLLKSAGVRNVFIEPGTCLVERSVYLVSTVVDVIDHGDRRVAVLDTTTSHMPDTFAYQRPPMVYGTSVTGGHEYILAGASCLAGDLFGDYAFAAPLGVGSRIVFERVGDYTSVKASMFNGINLPTVYAYCDGRAIPQRRYDYRDFLEVFAGKPRGDEPASVESFGLRTIVSAEDQARPSLG
jgi:carboxynorspermidine decarboxylase